MEHFPQWENRETPSHHHLHHNNNDISALFGMEGQNDVDGENHLMNRHCSTESQQGCCPTEREIATATVKYFNVKQRKFMAFSTQFYNPVGVLFQDYQVATQRRVKYFSCEEQTRGVYP